MIGPSPLRLQGKHDIREDIRDRWAEQSQDNHDDNGETDTKNQQDDEQDDDHFKSGIGLTLRSRRIGFKNGRVTHRIASFRIGVAAWKQLCDLIMWDTLQ